eukprot:gene12417-biopygen7751
MAATRTAGGHTGGLVCPAAGAGAPGRALRPFRIDVPGPLRPLFPDSLLYDTTLRRRKVGRAVRTRNAVVINCGYYSVVRCGDSHWRGHNPQAPPPATRPSRRRTASSRGVCPTQERAPARQAAERGQPTHAALPIEPIGCGAVPLAGQAPVDVRASPADSAAPAVAVTC